MDASNTPTAFLIISDEKLNDRIQSVLFGSAQAMIRVKATSISGDCDKLGLSFVMATKFQYEVVGTFGGYLFHVDVNFKGKTFELGLITPPFQESDFEITSQSITAERLIEDSTLN